MKTKTIKLYRFKELKKDIQKKVLEKFRQDEDFYFLEELIKENLEETLKENKIAVLNNLGLRYSLSYCQGDGLSITGLFKWKDFYIKIENNSRYAHKYNTEIYIYKPCSIEGEKEAEQKVYDKFKEIYYKICDDLEKYGYALIEDALKDENIKENIEINDYYFTKEGRIESLN